MTLAKRVEYNKFNNKWDLLGMNQNAAAVKCNGTLIKYEQQMKNDNSTKPMISVCERNECVCVLVRCDSEANIR